MMRGSNDDSDAMAKQARYDYLRSILACPVCKQPVDFIHAVEKIRCGHCVEEYRVLGDVPIMLEVSRALELNAMLSRDRDSERMQQEFYDTWSKLERVYRAIHPPQILLGLDKIKKVTKLLNSQGGEAWGLEIGSGKRRYHQRLINLDIAPFTDVDIVGVGECLPFLQESFHLVVSQAVLEHAKYPILMADEMYRVLKPGGYLYADVAFMQPFHGYPAHYQNYTLDGLAQLFYRFKKVEIGVVDGPSAAMASCLKFYFSLFVSSRSIRIPLNLFTEWLTFPLRFLDLYLRRKPEAHKMAVSLYFFGTKG